tara:strand:+ start:41 stop:505 length:465 start_codon:yes stop_codon:yes gene_type:complete
MYTKKNGRVSYRSGKRSNFKRNNTFINKSRNKGNVTQQYNKFLKLAKEASSSGDRIQSELYYQYTDHYYRVMVELGISFEEHEGSENKSLENKTIEVEEKDSSKEEEELSEEKNLISQDNSPEVPKEDLESIESIPFISDPPKKKSTKRKKVPV